VGGAFTVEQPGPELPAETSIRMPAARVLATPVRRMLGVVQPSAALQPQELTVMWGALLGSPWPVVPPTG
jgi:hypothetical protein